MFEDVYDEETYGPVADAIVVVVVMDGLCELCCGEDSSRVRDD